MEIMSNLVIVESPYKATTIKSYLGSNYRVIASKGHIRDLPKSTFGVDIENGFATHYINIRGRGDILKEIKKEAKGAGKIYFATDPDREGEAISWHLAMALGFPVDTVYRITFNEVTKTAVKAAIKAPRQIDMNIVNAQQTRRILDRIVGYKLTPLLWKNVRSGLSAGRVQSVATRILVDRENEIRSFIPSEYWNIDVLLAADNEKSFAAHYWGNKDGKVKLESSEQAMRVVNDVTGNEFHVDSVKRTTRHKQPAPPFTTSSMLQEASRRLGFQSQRIMKVAQELYEGVNLGTENGGVHGLITYMRTDSLRISDEAQAEAKEYIIGKYGEEYLPSTPRQYKAQAGAQDAHEAIRPVHSDLEPAAVRKHLTPDQYKLYKLIWERFIASQMQAEALSVLNIECSCKGHIFRAGGYTVLFRGYTVLYEESVDETQKPEDSDDETEMRLPDINENTELPCREVNPTKHFTKAPPRYNEGSLIDFLKEKGIGRPSTYATIITTIIQRDYVSRDGKMLVPTQLGEVTTELMKQYFPTIVDYKFTADIETKLDGVEQGNTDMYDVLENFWKGFEKQLENAVDKLGASGVEVPVEETDMICEKCGSKMIIKNGRYGKFAACPNYPTCKNTKPLVTVGNNQNSPENAEKHEPVIAEGMKCEKCGADMLLRVGKFGSFYACSRYPECKFTKQKVKELDILCPECGGKIVVKYGRSKAVFYGCEHYPECKFSSWDMPTDEKCPECGGMLFRKKGKALLVCHNKDCGYSRQAPDKNDSDNAPAEEK